MNRRQTIEYLKLLDRTDFTEETDILPDDCDDPRLYYYLHPKIGYITDYGEQYKVEYLEDNIGKYVAISFVYDGGTQHTVDYASSKIIEGRCRLMDNGNILLMTMFPLIEVTFIPKQLSQGLREMREMINLCKYAPE